MKNQLSAPSFVFKMIFFGMFTIALLSEGCLKKKMQKEEQITISQEDHSANNDSALNSIQGNLSFSQITTKPNSVVLTGLADHRLVTVYKSRNKSPKKREVVVLTFNRLITTGRKIIPRSTLCRVLILFMDIIF